MEKPKNYKTLPFYFPNSHQNTPVKIRVENFTLTWTCNLAESCHNKEYFYAKSKMAE